MWALRRNVRLYRAPGAAPQILLAIWRRFALHHRMTTLRSVCVYCASSSRGPESHKDAARALGRLLAENNIRLVFGGGHVGLMGVVADATLAAGGEVTGVIPGFLRDLELAHDGCDEMIVTESMHSRKLKMAELSDAFIILPGGLGTLDESFEIITWRQLGLHDKPIVVLDLDGYWQPLQALVDHIAANNYMRPNDDAPLYRMVERIDDVLPALRAAPAERQPIETKWL
jgi:uncharacterized protein (TIGR00730 family)